ncbi:MAG: hypothetical protein KAJ62_00965 [Desulfobacteraceae bacterium]|nr:hypothetical protein [Desulfobacteraceae bacterium]
MIAGIHISPSDIILRKETFKNTVFSSLKTDQKVEAKVLRVFSENKAEVLIAGKKVIIKSPFLLVEGEKLRVNLIKESENQNLRIASHVDSPAEGKISEKIASLIRLISKSNPFAGLSKTENSELLELLKSISLKSDKADKNFLPRLVNKSGILLEQKLSYLLKQGKDLPLKHEILNIIKNDIKGYVLNQLQSSGHQSAGNLKVFSEYSANIENFQTLNAQSSDTGKYLIPFPIFANDSFSFGQLFIDLGNSKEENKQENKDKIINISFLLDMSKLGALRADFSIYKKAISGVFNLSSIEICDFVKNMLPQLKKRLSKIEYLVHTIECKVASREDVSPTSFIESFTKDENRILNIII